MLVRKSEKRPEKKNGDVKAPLSSGALGRRAFLKRSGVVTGALAALGSLPLTAGRIGLGTLYN